MKTMGWLVVFAVALAALNAAMNLGIPIWFIILIPFIPTIVTLSIFFVVAAIAMIVAFAALVGVVASEFYDEFRK